jgi:hypothetical protein
MRRLFTLLSIVSLLLCVTTCASWVASHLWPADARPLGDVELSLRDGWFHAGRDGRTTGVGFALAPWAIASTAAAALALGVARVVRRRTDTPSGLCAACGYDLRATPDRCPECGVVVAAKRTA